MYLCILIIDCLRLTLSPSLATCFFHSHSFLKTLEKYIYSFKVCNCALKSHSSISIGPASLRPSYVRVALPWVRLPLPCFKKLRNGPSRTTECRFALSHCLKSMCRLARLMRVLTSETSMSKAFASRAWRSIHKHVGPCKKIIV